MALTGLQRVENPLTEKVRQLQEDQGSVFEPVTRKIARWLAKLVPTEGDPSEVINPLSMPIGVGVSAFMKHGVPDVVARKANTERALGQLVKSLIGIGMPPDAIGDVKLAMQRYPRVLAHTSYPGEAQALIGEKLGNGVTRTAQNGTSEIFFNGPRTYAGKGEMAELFLPGADAGTVMHELTHAAQGVGLKKQMTPVYSKASDMFGYWENPLEKSAREVQHRFFPRASDRPALPTNAAKVENKRNLQVVVDQLNGIKF